MFVEAASGHGDGEGVLSLVAALAAHDALAVIPHIQLIVDHHTPVARQRGIQSWAEHRELIAAISDRDEARAQQVMRAHTEHTRTFYHQREGAADR